jgi:hypothetical protein
MHGIGQRNSGDSRLCSAEQRRNWLVGLKHPALTIRRAPAMRLLTLIAFGWLIANVPTVMAQGTGAGGASSSGGSARGGGATAGPGTTAPGTAAPTSPSVNVPGVPSPGNSPTRSIDGAAPGSTTGTATAPPAPRVEQPGVSTGAASGTAAARPGAAQSPNSDGYAECMAMGPGKSDTSRESWSATCDRARLPPK